MTYVNVKIDNDFDVVVGIDKKKFSIGTSVLVQSKDALDYGTITKIYSKNAKIKKDGSYSFLRFANSNDKKIYNPIYGIITKAFEFFNWSGLPPEGPAIPVVEMPISAPLIMRTPCAISLAVSTLYSVYSLSVSSETSRSLCFILFE